MNGVFVVPGLAGNLAQDQIVALDRRENQRRPSLRLAEIGEGKVDDDDAALYKLAQAASSSGASQSFASADSAAMVGTDASECSSASTRRNTRSRSRSCSDSGPS